MSQTFGRRDRVRSVADFREVFRRRRSVRTRIFTVFWKPNDEGHPRLGLSVGRRLGGAPVRNRIKRIMREVFRINRDLAPEGIDLIIVPRDSMAARDFHQVKAAYCEAMIKLKRQIKKEDAR